jgi:acetyltransferase-like isoleucine patch superfamily enzyme
MQEIFRDARIKMAFLSELELLKMNFASLGSNVLISTRASIYNADQIAIGDNSRIDDFCLLSGKIEIGRNVHFAAFSNVAGGVEGVSFGDFSGLAYGCQVFSQADDYHGETLNNPTVPEIYKTITRASVRISRHVVIGTNSIVFPGVTVAEGCSIGAMSLVNRDTEEWGIYVGIPARRIKDRSKSLLQLEIEYRNKNE